MKIEKTLTTEVLVDSKMRIVPEVLHFTDTLALKGKSVNTISTYLCDLKVFYEWLEQENIQFWEVKAPMMLNLVRYCDAKSKKGKMAPATWNRMLSTLSAFYRHHQALGVESPILKVQGVSGRRGDSKGFLVHAQSQSQSQINYFKRKTKKKIDRKRLYPDQALHLYNSIGQSDEADGETSRSVKMRDRLIFKILYETGMRIGELLHLQINDFDLPDPHEKSGNIYLVERPEKSPDRQLKTGERVIPVSSELLYAIDDYILYHRPNKVAEPYIFVSHKGNSLGQPMSRYRVEETFRELSERSGIKCTPHALRHTHASNLADEGYDVNFIRVRLGHASIGTSAKYVQPSLSASVAAYERYLERRKEVALK